MKRKNMKRKNIIWIIVGISIICVTYFGYKGFNLYYYDMNNITEESYNEFIKGLEIKNTLTIQPAFIEYDSYLTFKNIKVPNSFKDFEKQENTSTVDSVKYNLYDENRNLKASFWVGVTDTYVNLLKMDKTIYTEDNRVTNDDLTSLLNKNNIKTDIDLFKYLKEQKYASNNIFTTVKEMKQNYTIKYLLSIMLPKTENITLLDGLYTGYILNCNNDVKEVSIIKDDKRYVFTFFKLDYFTDDYISELLKSIEID